MQLKKAKNSTNQEEVGNIVIVNKSKFVII